VNVAPQSYATRTSTVLLVRRDGSVLFIERDIWVLDEEGSDAKPERGKGERMFRFHIERKESA
jgi:uncharacterized protein with NRDE domain